ncbi:MAG: sensor histidine kinase [Bradymonadales bacterium]|nr:sensor histidine kinase [Bradymonadales bacterium]
MIPLLYALLLLATAGLLYRRLRGRTLEQLVRRPPPRSDLNAVVSTLSYIEHELIKHRIPVLSSLMAKRTWNDQDRLLLERTVGHQESSLSSEFARYLDMVQRAAGRTLVNFGRDKVISRASRVIAQIQRTGERWARSQDHPGGGPSPLERKPIEEACQWLQAPFREYLLELNRSLLCTPITRTRLLASARRGLLQAEQQAECTVAEPPPDCVARILAADLDVALRNLVRNAVQAQPGSSATRRVHLDVLVTIDETGEESILIRVHDTNPTLLSRSQIYGREAKRGLGLVTAALARHQGALRCLPSELPGFTKMMEIRLPRSMHPPDPRALAIAGGRLAPYLLPASLVLAHGVLLWLLVIPYFTRLPVELDSLELPSPCHLEERAEGQWTSVVCTMLDPTGHPLSSPLAFTLRTEPAAMLQLHTEGADCPGVRLERPATIQVDLAACLASGQWEPHLTVFCSSLLYRPESRLTLKIRAPLERRLAAAQEAIDRAELPLARRLLPQLSGPEIEAAAPAEMAVAARCLAQAALVEGFALHLDTATDPSDVRRRLCSLWAEVQESTRIIREAASPLSGREAAAWEVEADFLDSQGHLWLEGNLEQAARLLAEIDSFASAGPVATARFYLALLGSEGVGQVSLDRLETALRALHVNHERPLLASSVDPGSTFLVQLVGSPALFGQMQAIPVPEAICALLEGAPDLYLPSGLAQSLGATCNLRELDPIASGYRDWAGAYLRRIAGPIDCREY